MSLSIKNPTVLELTRELAGVLGTSQVSALEVAVREKLERELTKSDARRERVLRDLIQLRELASGGPTRQQIDDDMYDEWGLPR
ncbi:type II toxin-antitoxin system VapB family antitoxin [Microbacterium sp.]|uniref:type II toxin-antitoxin system VapB family antitoxin n=1 Tax=Microbacterium sp. TaxID=51671 RepID=UPI0039E2F8CE